jgi:two-component system sensor histidine kinase MprB
MTLRARLALASAAAVAVAVALVAAFAYVMVRNELRAELDEALLERANEIASSPFAAARLFGPQNAFPDLPEPRLGAAGGYVQLVSETGETLRPPGAELALPVSERTVEAAETGRSEPVFEDATVAGTHLRLITVPVGPGTALQIARDLTEVDEVLGRLRLILVLLALGGIALAAALGLVVSRASLAPVRRLTETAEHITATHDLSRRVDAEGRGELSRLATSFNTMLGTLEQSVGAQRRLVADASHELRTPLTSLRTNVELLSRPNALSAEERARALDDVGVQIEELTALVGDVVELARDGEPHRAVEDVRLDLLVADAVERARRHAPAVRFETDLDESAVAGVPERLHRAIANVLDNAAKWSPEGAAVEVRVERGEVTVRDHGPGIDDADLPHVFDRFYRAPSARGLPGSGLGLAIVRQVVDSHGGSVAAERAEDGGTLVRIRLPEAAPNS